MTLCFGMESRWNPVHTRNPMQRFVAQPQGSKTLQRNSCAMENFQIEQPTSRGTRNGVALGLLGLVAVALLLTPGALTGLAMADGFNGGAHLSASTYHSGMHDFRSFGCVFGTECNDFRWVLRDR